MKAPISNSRCVKFYGRRVSGAWDRPGKERHAIANRASRHSAKSELWKIYGSYVESALDMLKEPS